MLVLNEKISLRRENLKNINIDTTDVDYLNKFSADIRFLANQDYIDLIVLYYMVMEDCSYKFALQEVNSFKNILRFLENRETEDTLVIVDAFDALNAKYGDKLGDRLLKDYLSLKSDDELFVGVKAILRNLMEDFTENEINVFLKWLNDFDLSEIICIVTSIKGIKTNMNSVYDEVDDLGIPEFLSDRVTKKLSNKFVKSVNGSYLKRMNHEFKDELEALRIYKEKKNSEINLLRKKINKELKNLDLLENDLNNNSLNLESLRKYNLGSDLFNLALIELIKARNVEYSNKYKEVEKYRRNSIDKLEILFKEYGYNFNVLSEDEQSLLSTAYQYEKIKANLQFIKTSSLFFLSEEDEAFVNLLIQDADVLMQLDSLLVRKKINPDYILKYGSQLNSLNVKILALNVNKLDSQKVNFQALQEDNDKLLLDLNNKLLDIIIKYGINLGDDNLKRFDFLEDVKLLNIIDKYIEIGLIDQIQNLPNLISYYSNTVVKRIILMQQLGQNYLTDKNTLNQIVRSGKDFYLGDEDLDLYISSNYSVYIDDDIKQLLDSKDNIELLNEIPEEILFIEDYKKNDYLYMIGYNYFSRLKVLRCLKTLMDEGYTNYKDILFQVLIYNYPKNLNMDTINELKSFDNNIFRKRLL